MSIPGHADSSIKMSMQEAYLKTWAPELFCYKPVNSTYPYCQNSDLNNCLTSPQFFKSFAQLNDENTNEIVY